MELEKSVGSLILDELILLLMRLCIWLPRNCLGGEDVLIEEALLDKILQVFSEGPTIDGLVLFAVVVGAVLLQPG